MVEGGGFLGIGDAHFRIPWSEVKRTRGRDSVTVGMTEEQASRRGLFDRPEWVATGPREFRLSQLLDDYVTLSNGVGFGYVEDAVFNEKGKLLGVIVNRDVHYGPTARYAYPYYGYAYGWDPGHEYYAIPFDTVEDAGKAPKLDEDKFRQMGGMKNNKRQPQQGQPKDQLQQGQTPKN